MAHGTWLVTANSSIARIYKIQGGFSLQEIKVLEHPESRLKSGDLVSDKPGRDFESMGTTRHRMEPPMSPKQQEFMIFAKQISEYINSEAQKGGFKKLYLCASPNLLGLIRQHLSGSTMKLIAGEVDKDMTHIRPEEIISHLPFIVTVS